MNNEHETLNELHSFIYKLNQSNEKFEIVYTAKKTDISISVYKVGAYKSLFSVTFNETIKPQQYVILTELLTSFFK